MPQGHIWVGARWAASCFALGIACTSIAIGAPEVGLSTETGDTLAVHFSVNHDRTTASLFYDVEDRDLLLFEFQCREKRVVQSLRPHLADLPRAYPGKLSSSAIATTLTNPLFEADFAPVAPAPVDLSEAGR